MRRFTITVERVRRLVRGRNLVLLVLVVLAAAGSGLWFHLRWGTGPAEPMCLVMTRQDVRPLVGEAVSVSDDRGGPIPSPEPGYWTCSVHGESASIRVEATPDADERLSNYKDPETPVLHTLTTRRGATSQPIPGTAGAVVVSWIQDGSAHAGWFEAGSAVVVSMDTSDDAAATARLGDLAHLLKRRAPQLLDATGFTPPSPQPNRGTTDAPTPAVSPTVTATMTPPPSRRPPVVRRRSSSNAPAPGEQTTNDQAADSPG